MAKRKRLGPARTDTAPSAPSEQPQSAMQPLGGATAPIATVASDAALVAAFEEVSDTLTQARSSGRMILDIPLADIRTDYLVRDRLATDADGMEELKASLRARGQQTPIEVTALPGGGYGLISGWRRVAALTELAAEGGIDTVQALLRQPDDAAEAYVAMVEENEIRVGLSYYERARIAVKAVEQGVYPDQRRALQGLFANASRPRRSKIGSFMRLVEALDAELRFPTHIGERLGLAVSKVLAETPAKAKGLTTALKEAAATTPEAEQAALEAALTDKKKLPERPVVETRIDSKLTVVEHPNGALLLRGSGVDAALRDRLIAWLREQTSNA